jgi:enoyl-CoA hydratase
VSDDDTWVPYSLKEPLVSLAVERRGAVARVTLLGPGKGNAMGPDFWREVPQLFGLLDADDEVRAIVVTGSGANFSYGLDLGAFAGDVGGTLADDGGLAGARTTFFAKIRELQASLTAVAECRKPVAAAIHGWCVGGGVDLAAACDVRYASADAKFSVREVRVAMVADVGSLQRLPGIIGEGHLRELALTGRDVDAARAAEIGLVNEVRPDAEGAMAAALAFAGEVAANPPIVVHGVKHLLDHNREQRIAEGLKYVAAWNAAFLPSHDLAEAMTAFLERRPPEFKGR